MSSENPTTSSKIFQIKMMPRSLYIKSLLICLLATSTLFCSCQQRPKTPGQSCQKVICGAEQCELYFPWLKDKKFALVVNQTSVIEGKSIVDSLCSACLRPAFIFAPEHGFRGTDDAGAHVADGKDLATGLDIVSLYGKNKKPSPAQMQALDCIVFDIQDVGCRFYTYLSTLHYVMEACAENDVELIVLDRPNPNDYIDGPTLEADCRSFVGMHPIPILHGCTLGEMAQMINGEGWINGRCRLRVVKVKNWQHRQVYSLPVKPSPNLPNDHAIRLYPSLCLFEGTIISVGRGTSTPFEILGHPDPKFGDFRFTPRSLPGFDKHPMYQDKICYGEDLRQDTLTKSFSLKYLCAFFEKSGKDSQFFSRAAFFDLLAGNHLLRQQIQEGLSEEEIRQSWEKDLASYRQIRESYLLYEE